MYRRSPDLIGDETPVCDLIKYFAETHCDDNDIICQVHVTSPFLSVKTLKEAHNIISNEKKYDSVVGKFDEFFKVGNDCVYLGLLQHDLGQPNPVGVYVILPR